MKSDSQLQHDVLHELRWDPRVGDVEIGIAVKDGVVTLSGYVDTYAQRTAAERAVQRVGGVRAVAEELKVRLPDNLERPDSDIAHQVARALSWHSEVPGDQVKARVENGWVWLEGQVDWEFQRQAAERAVRYLAGVRGVTSAVRIRKHATSRDVAKQIKTALHRGVEADARSIAIETRGGRVTLRGTVRSLAERKDAERAAWGTQGVTAVEDRLVVVTT
jgi:osmotically-inducible protein OsmY